MNLTDYKALSVTVKVMPLGTFSDAPPHGTDGQLLRVSALEMAKCLPSDDQHLPITVSSCMKLHEPRAVGYVKRFYIQANSLWADGILWTGLLPSKFDVSKMGCSVEFFDAKITNCWARNFRFNAIALLEKNKAAFKSTFVRIDEKCTVAMKLDPEKYPISYK